MAMFQFMGGEIVLVTAGEAKRPMRNLPIAARYMYLLPVSLYLIAILFVGLNVDYLDPRLYHSHVSYFVDSRLEGIQTGARSPFVIAVQNAGIESLPGFLNACYVFSALTAALKVYKRTLNRDGKGYREKHYRAHWQPLWAILGLVLCTLLMIFSGWAAIYDLAARSPGVNRADSIVDLIAAYLGPFLFFIILISYKLLKRTRIRSIDDMRNVWFVRDAAEDEEYTRKTTRRAQRNRFYEFLRWIR
ncbi:MAG: hypothetical protein Q9171_003492 [Xanthocarpia ochracea]